MCARDSLGSSPLLWGDIVGAAGSASQPHRSDAAEGITGIRRQQLLQPPIPRQVPLHTGRLHYFSGNSSRLRTIAASIALSCPSLTLVSVFY